jgi:hypothetical protein
VQRKNIERSPGRKRVLKALDPPGSSAARIDLIKKQSL